MRHLAGPAVRAGALVASGPPWAPAPFSRPARAAACLAARHESHTSADGVVAASGSDRYGTATAISAQYAPGVPAVYIATGTTLPDALAAGAAAGANSPSRR